MAEARPDILTMRGVAKEFRRGKAPPFLAVTDLHVTVEDLPGKGEFICLVGPSGCGKSTLLQLVAGFDTHLPQTRGELLFCGEPITGPGPDRGMLFQSYGCYPHLSVLDNIAFGLRLHRRELELTHGDIIEVANEWLTRVRLSPGDARKYPHELSGGMRQRVALARSLALKPRCLLMDEPFSALDEPTRFDMQDLIVDLWSEVEATVLLVSHSVAEAVYLGDRVWVMSAAPGTVVAEFADVPAPDPAVPAMVAQADPAFAEVVATVSNEFFRILRAPREELAPIHADGTGLSLAVGGEA
jgi:NitT/TauT family transport system ATP-binding protein